MQHPMGLLVKMGYSTAMQSIPTTKVATASCLAHFDLNTTEWSHCTDTNTSLSETTDMPSSVKLRGKERIFGVSVEKHKGEVEGYKILVTIIFKGPNQKREAILIDIIKTDEKPCTLCQSKHL